jgi:two-component system, response regulator, stage 0 sporulation protein F
MTGLYAEPNSQDIKGKVLVADDDADTRDLLSFLLISEGWEVIEARDGYELVELARQAKPCVLIIDQRMPNLTGTEAYLLLRSEGVHLPAVLVSAARDIAEKALSVGIQHWLLKPCDFDRLIQLVENLC